MNEKELLSDFEYWCENCEDVQWFTIPDKAPLTGEPPRCVECGAELEGFAEARERIQAAVADIDLSDWLE